MIWKEFKWQRHSTALPGKMPLEEDALASSFRCTLGEKTPFIQSAPKMSKLFVAGA
jgi:hypothetical protein